MKSTSTDNPFAVPARKPAIFRSLKSLLVVVFCLGVVLTIQFGSKHWLLHQLTSHWDRQPVSVRVERLGSLAELGDLGRPMLVRALLDPDRRVARSAFDHLFDQQAEWLAIPDDQADAKYRDLAERLAGVASELPGERRGWLSTLLNSVITETVEHTSDDASHAYSVATDLIASKQPEHTPVESVETSSVRVALRTDALPVDLGPPDARREEGRAGSTSSEGDASIGLGSSNDSRTGELQASPPAEDDDLQPLPDSGSEKSAAGAGDGSPTKGAQRVVVPVQHLTDAPFETYSTRSVIAWLRSVQPRLRDIARSELVRRGFGEVELELAARMADPDLRVRLGLLNDLNHRTDIDPRRWLLWMAEDAERDVRLRAVTSLATMHDPNIREKLRERLPHETDPAVVSLLRRVLSQR